MRFAHLECADAARRQQMREARCHAGKVVAAFRRIDTLARVSRWVEWHRSYEDVESPLARRLVIVQRDIAAALSAAPAGPIRIVSMCTGDGRDLLGVIADHPRGRDVVGRLVELDPELAGRARAGAPAGIEVVETDAGTTAAYAGAVPGDLVLACGVFGNISLADVERTIATLPMLCAPGATVVWTRHRSAPDRTALLRDAFTAAGFAEVAFDAPDGSLFTVGAHRLVPTRCRSSRASTCSSSRASRRSPRRARSAASGTT